MSPVLRSFLLFVALRGRGLQAYTQLVAVGFALLGTHLPPFLLFTRQREYARLVLSCSSLALFGPQGIALTANTFGQSSSY